ncbi:MAG: hypothetical protein ABSG30_15365 [Steroidobacteraceae bacterium]|jgi:hypothetical protein
MFRTESAGAGVWITEPVIGVAGEYSTNPGLLYVPHSSETDGAILIDAPTTYHEDSESLSIQPSVRIANSSGYSSLTSDYAHLTAVGELDTELGTLAATAELARDSSLSYTYSLNGSVGVRRDTTVADITWTHAFTERLSFNWDINSSRVIYGQSSAFTTLTDYHYSSATPALSWNADERTVVKLLASVGLYDSTDGTTKSSNSNAQLGVVRQLTELWTLNATAGYSRESNSASEYEEFPFYIGPFLFCCEREFVHLKSTENGTVFSANVTRKGELLSLAATASRSVVPTGFAFLATQTTYALSFDYPRTERWTFDGGVQETTSREPQALGPIIDDSYLSLSLSAAWLVTEKWTLKLQATKVSARYSPPSVDVASTGVSIQLSRHLDPITWQ